MARLKAIFGKFSTQMNLVALLVMVVFITMDRPVEDIKDFAYQGGYLFLALGEHGIRVLDVSINPLSPQEVGAYDTDGSTSALSVLQNAEGNTLFVADGKSGIKAYSISPDGKLKILRADNKISSAQDIAVAGKYAWVATGKGGLSVVKIDDKYPSLSTGGTYMWKVDGVGSAVQVVIYGDRAIVVDNSWVIHILNIADPKSPAIINSFPLGFPVNDIYVYGGIAYIATNGGGLILLDINLPEGNEIINKYEAIKNVQSVSVYGAFACISGGKDGILALEVSDPWGEIIPVGGSKKVSFSEYSSLDLSGDGSQLIKNDPIEVAINATRFFWVGDVIYYSDGLNGLRTLLSQQIIDVKDIDTFGAANLKKGWVEDVTILQDHRQADDSEKKTFAYLAGGERGLWIIDVTNKGTLQDAPYVDSVTGEASDRVIGYAQAVTSYGDFAYVAYKDRGIQVFQTSDPGHPVPWTPIRLDGDTLDLTVINENYIYVAAGSNGLRIINLGEQGVWNQIGIEDTPGTAVGVFVSDNHAYVADSGEGLQIINVLDPYKPTLVASQDTPGDARAVTVYKHKVTEDSPPEFYAYVADGSGGIAIFKVTNPQDPLLINTIKSSEFVQDVCIQDGLLYVSERKEGLIIFDLGDPENPTRRSTAETPGSASAVYVKGDFAFIADGNRGLRIINIANTDDPRESGFFDMPTQVNDLVINPNHYAYLVDGVAGMWTVDLGTFTNPVPVDFLDIPGELGGIDLAGDGKIYIAGGSKGLYVVDITGNPIHPSILASYGKLADIRDVKVKDGFAYVANGGGGLPVLSILDPQNISQTGFFGTHGFALDVDIGGNYAYIVTTDSRLDITNIDFPGEFPEVKPVPPMNTILGDTRKILVTSSPEQAFVSDGSNGLFVFNVNQPYKPVQIYHLDTPGTLNDVALSKNYAFLADGEAGIAAIYIPEATVFQTNPDWYYQFSDEDGPNGESATNCGIGAQNIAVIPRVIKDVSNSNRNESQEYPADKEIHYYVYVAADECGLKTFDYRIRIAFSQQGLYVTPGEATFWMVVRGYLGFIKGTILGTLQKSLTADVGLSRIFSVARLVSTSQFSAMNSRIKNTSWLYLFGVFLFTTGIFYWLALIAHFILPVRDPLDGWKSFRRLWFYARGKHGPIVLAREGRGLIRSSEPQCPGVSLVDLNSAIVIEEYPVSRRGPRQALRRLQKKRNKVGDKIYQVRAEGPGVVFLQAFERVRGIVDLRRQTRSLQVEAHTRDGIEVRTNVWIIFTLGESPDTLSVTYQGEKIAGNIRAIANKNEGVTIPGKIGKVHQVEVVSELQDSLDDDEKREVHRFIQSLSIPLGDSANTNYRSGRSQRGPYLFDRQRVFDAIVTTPYDVNEKEIKDWADLPAQVAAGIFRNLINREAYEHLFQPTEKVAYPIKDLKEKFSQIMRSQGVLAFQYVENSDGSQINEGQVWDARQIKFSPIETFQTPKPLRARGIKVALVGFSEILPKHPDISDTLTNYWRSEWQKQILIEEADYDKAVIEIKNYAHAQAQKNIVNSFMMILNEREYSMEVLTLRVFQALEAAAADPITRRLLPRDTIQMLGEIRNLLLPGE